MTGVAAVPGMSAAVPNAAVAPTAAPGSGSLLPTPSFSVGSIEGLYALMTEANAVQEKNGKTDVELKFDNKRAALDKYKEELAKAAEEKSDGIFSTLATVGMVVVAAAATVMTLGAAAPAVVGVGLALSAAGFAVGKTKCLDGILGEGVSQWVGMGMGLCGAVMTGFGAGGGSALETAAETAQCASQVAEGCQQVDDTAHAYKADQHMIAAKDAEHGMRRLQQAIDDVIATLQDMKDSSRRGTETINSITATEGQTLVLAAGGRA